MSTATYVYSTTLTVISCGSCGIGFAVPQDFDRKRLEDHRSWWCPNGHERHYIGETEAQKLRRELKWEQDRRAAIAAARDQALASLRATKGVVTKLRKRTAAGDCPFCGQHVYQLARHVTRLHAAEAAEAIAKPEPTP